MASSVIWKMIQTIKTTCIFLVERKERVTANESDSDEGGGLEEEEE